jgi:Calcineurin-like phosphoesterase
MKLFPLSRARLALLSAALLGIVFLFAWCAGPLTPTSGRPGSAEVPQVNPSVPPVAPTTASSQDVVFVGAGDIADCGAPYSEATARLLDRMQGSVFSLGDNVYPTGSAEQFANCYERTWGRHRARTHPTVGNHDWEASAAAPYFAYFGPAAGPAGRGYYSYDLGAWHVLSLNSNISSQVGSPQYQWVRDDLAASGMRCSLAYWHHPLFSSGFYGNLAEMKDLWRLLDTAGVDLVLGAHNHMYERFAPQDADGRPSALGMREFVVGTGGAPLTSGPVVQRNSEVRENQTFGVLKFTLRSAGYSWEFVPIDGQSFSDAGTAECVR